MKKIKRIFMMIFMIALCFSLKTNVNAVTLPELKIARFDYDIGDKFGYIKAIIDFALEREDLSSKVMEYLKEVVK